MSHFAGLLRGAYAYEDERKIDAAVAVIPLEELFEAAAPEPSNETELGFGYCEEDRLIIHMLKWFKSWFAWVNAPACDKCAKQTENMVGTAQPTKADLKYGAKVVELWECAHCGNQARFPRYNDVVKLLSFRQGRCGEWCNVMHLLLRALGRDTRYVWNSEDHVWNEIWSEDKQRWIHIDSCEAAFDTPLIYTDGWGKKMAYVIGASVTGLADITQRYVRRPEMALPRTLVPEDQLREILANLTTMARRKLEPIEEVNAYLRDQLEAAELARCAPTATAALPPRQSGSADWTRERGEAGQ